MDWQVLEIRLQAAMQGVVGVEERSTRTWSLHEPLALDAASLWELEYELESIFGVGFVGAGVEVCETFGSLVLWANAILEDVK